MVCMGAEFVDSVARHRRNLQIFEHCLHIVLCVNNVWENRESRRMWNAVCNPFLECKEHAMGSSKVQRLVRLFNEGRKNVYDDLRGGRPSVVNEDLVRAVEEKIRENRWFTITPLSLHFPQISWSLLHKIVCSQRSHYHLLCNAGGIILRWRDTKTGAMLWQVPQQWWKLCQKVVYSMYIKWQYTWFVIYSCFFLNSSLELTFWITLIFLTRCVGMFMVHLHTKFHMPSCYDSISYCHPTGMYKRWIIV